MSLILGIPMSFGWEDDLRASIVSNLHNICDYSHHIMTSLHFGSKSFLSWLKTSDIPTRRVKKGQTLFHCSDIMDPLCLRNEQLAVVGVGKVYLRVNNNGRGAVAQAGVSTLFWHSSTRIKFHGSILLCLFRALLWMRFAYSAACRDEMGGREDIDKPGVAKPYDRSI